MRVLVTRTDRMGDVILATPVLKALRQMLPHAKIYFLVQKQWMPILQFDEEIELIEYDPNETISRLAARLATYSFSRAYVLRDEKKVTWAIWRAGIPERIGPYSNFRSFFLLNRGRFQKRSKCKMHEAEYNLDLVIRKRPAKMVFELPRAWLKFSESAKRSADRFLSAQSLSAKNFFIIHPGSSGSARYVKQVSLQDLARALISRGDTVCVSGGPSEDPMLEQFLAAVPGVKLLSQKDKLGLDGMAEVFRMARAVIAHGTGPLHLAAAVGTPTLAIFPPIFVLSEKRWGPLQNLRSVWTPPEVFCPALYRCIGEKCEYYDCMDRFQVNEALNRLGTLIS